MTRFLLRFAAIVLFISGAALTLSILTGRTLSTASIAVFLTVENGTDLLISRVDSGVKTVFEQRIPQITRLPYSLDARCRAILRLSSGDQGWLAALNLNMATMTLSPDTYPLLEAAEFLPDGRHLWMYAIINEAPGYYYAVLDTLTGSFVPVDLASFEKDTRLSVIWSPDSATGLVISGQVIPLSLYRLDPATGTLSARVRSAGYTYFWSPDSRYIASLTYENEVVLIDAQTMTLQTMAFAELNQAAGIVWTPDNRLLFLARESEDDANFQGYSLEPETNTVEALALQLPLSASRAELPAMQGWSPDGTRLFDPLSGRLLDAATGAELLDLGLPEDGAFRLALWSPDSRYLAVFGMEGGMLVVDVLTGEQHVLADEVVMVSFAEFAESWQTNPASGFLDTDTGTLWRLETQDGTPELVAVYTLRGAYLAAVCDPEAGS